MERFANDAESTLAEAIGSGDATLAVADHSSFPAEGDFRLRVDDELLLVTHVAGGVFTVERGIESTKAAAHAKGAEVLHVLTAEVTSAFATKAEVAGKQDASSAATDVELAGEREEREGADAAETKAREAADSTEATTRASADSAEKKAREEADSAEAKTRQEADSAEETARKAAVSTLTTAVATAQSTAETAEGAAATEKARAEGKEAELQSEIGTLENLVTGAPLIFKGVIDCSGNPKYPAAKPGHTYVVSVVGKIGGGAGAAVEPGDAVICTVTAAEGTQAEVGAKWIVLDSATAANALVKGERERAEGIEAGKQPLAEALTALAATTPGTFGKALLEATTAAKARESLGLGTAATKDAGAAGAAGKVLNADDPTTSDSRTPKAHAASHKTAGSDPLAAADIGAAATSHTHAQADVTGLVAALEGKQPLDSDLTAIAALTTTAYGRELLTLANAAAGRTAFGLGTAAVEPASAFQPADSDLTAIAALTTTAFGRSLLEGASAEAVRNLIGATDASKMTAAALAEACNLKKENTELQNLTGLGIEIAESGIYKITFFLLVEAANTTEDLKVGFSLGATGATGYWGAHACTTGISGGIGTGGTGLTTPATLLKLSESGSFASIAGVQGIKIEATIIAGGTKGTVQIQASQNTSNGGVLNVLKGSSVEARKVA
jgi:hypothetical protein